LTTREKKERKTSKKKRQRREGERKADREKTDIEAEKSNDRNGLSTSLVVPLLSLIETSQYDVFLLFYSRISCRTNWHS